MTESTPNEALELANLRLLLRPGLKFELHEYGGLPSYVVKEATSSGFFQLGLAEYAFVSLLDGRTTLQEAVQETAFKLGEDAFTIRDAIGTSHWLMQNGLAEPAGSGDFAGRANVDNLLEQLDDKRRNQVVSQLNPLFLRLPLGDPGSVIKAAAPLFGWIATKTFFVVWCFIVCVASFFLFQNSHELATATQAIFAPNAWLWLIATFIGMKIVHEFAHGLFCDRFGGRVSETGLVFILFMPIPYVDVTSCWGFSSKWRRIAVSAAGMYIELFLAAGAAILWSFSDDPLTRFHLFNVMLTGSLTTIFFNANFLMRFDGYFILCDLIEIPNLAQSGQQYLNYLGKKYLLGMDVKPSRDGYAHGFAIRAYGVAAFIWRIFICVSLSILATALLYGFGVVLAMLGIAMWIGMPIYKFSKLMTGKGASSRPPLKRLGFVTVPIIAGLIVAFFVLPWPVQVSAPAMIQYQDPAIVRAEASGFVLEVSVRNGQQVETGDLLVQLENRELETQLLALRMEQQRSLVRSRRHHTKREIASYQSEVASRLAIEKQITELERQIESLTVRAPANGTVVASDLESKPGQHLALGTELLKIVDERHKEVLLSVGQDDFDSFHGATGNQAIFVPRHSLSRPVGEITLIEPTASQQTDMRLTSYSGGSLAVRPASHQSSNDQESLELVRPRFRGIMQLPPEQNRDMLAGLIGQVRLNQYSDSIAIHLINRTRSWINNCFEVANHNVK